MAKVKIQGHASGTGVLTVTAPNTSTDRTITLPDATGTLLNSDGSGASLTALNATQLTSGTVPTARLGSGTANSSVHLRGDGTWAAAGTTYAGIDDQSSSNDDQLTITDNAVVVNEDSDDLDFRVESNANAYMFFVDGGTSYCSINGGVGSPEARALIGGESTGLQIKGNSNSSSTLGITRHTADANPPALRFLKSRNTTVNSYTVVADNDYLGEIGFHADDGTDYSTRGASIQARVDGTPGTNDMPTKLLFNTTANGANDTTTRLSILNDGRGLSPFTAKSWCLVAGTGTVTVHASHNVSSVTDQGTGQYRINFTNSMSSSNYSVNFTPYGGKLMGRGAQDSGYTEVRNYNPDNGNFEDNSEFNALVFANGT